MTQNAFHHITLDCIYPDQQSIRSIGYIILSTPSAP